MLITKFVPSQAQALPINQRSSKLLRSARQPTKECFFKSTPLLKREKKNRYRKETPTSIFRCPRLSPSASTRTHRRNLPSRAKWRKLPQESPVAYKPFFFPRIAIGVINSTSMESKSPDRRPLCGKNRPLSACSGNSCSRLHQPSPNLSIRSVRCSSPSTPHE
jgi:hypothetical protein